MKTIKIIVATLIIASGVLVLLSPELVAQPPNFPSAPNQTPIDGGLVAVALGLGGWATKKLSTRKK